MGYNLLDDTANQYIRASKRRQWLTFEGIVACKIGFPSNKSREIQPAYPITIFTKWDTKLGQAKLLVETRMLIREPKISVVLFLSLIYSIYLG